MGMIWGVMGLLVLVLAARTLKWLWWKPRRLEKALRAQGLKGTPYRLLFGDVKDNLRLTKEACSKPMSLSHAITPRVAPLFHKTMKEHGKISFTWFGPTPRVTVTDPKLVREVLSTKFSHFGRAWTSPASRLIATGIVGYEGEKWAKHRRILNPAFHVEKLRRMLPVFYACCDELVRRWDNKIGSEGTFEIDIWPELQNLTGDVISRTAFGSNYEEGRRIFQLQTEQAELVIQAAQRVYIPGYRFFPTPKNTRRKEIDREIQAILRGMIHKREKAIQTGKASGDDLLGLMIEFNSKHIQEQGKSKGGMTTKDIIEECKVFYFAGEETTSGLITWTMIVLSMHPSWQARAREEVIEAFGKNRPNYDELISLKIVTMILYEVLRLYPSLFQLNRRTYKTMKLGDVTYPPGVMLTLPIIFIHHDPEFWGDDADEFKPERFAEGISKASKDQVAFFPFGAGPRICIGQNFALLEAKMCLSMILQRFSFELSPSYAHAPYSAITLQPQHGAHIRLHRL